jgi:hypothetical protein
MDHRDRLLGLVKEKGPLLPGQINKEMKTNVLFASAMLAEMVDSKKLKLTAMKVGGSPLYYCEGQEPMLEKFGDRLHGFDHTTFSILKSSKILRDRDQEPQIRVSLRELKDFAVPLEVTAYDTADLFWKYYLVSDDEAESLIRKYVEKMYYPKEKKEESKEVQSTISDIGSKEQHESVDKSASQVKMTALEDYAVPEFSYQPSVSFSTTVDTEEPVKLTRKKQEKQEVQEALEPQPMVFPEEDDFFRQIKSYFDDSGIEILDFSVVRKTSEYDFVVRIPSNVGQLNYYCKARSKSKVNDGDLSAAFVQGQIRKLPILYISTGDLTKRAEELLSKEFRSMFVKKI